MVTRVMGHTLESVTAELTEAGAINYLKIYAVEDTERFPEMLHSLLGAQDKDQCISFMMLYLLDPTYPRSDIALATGTVSREKGWKL